MRNRIVLLLGFICSFTILNAQEFNCNVIIDAQQVQTQEQQVFADMRAQINDFMNNRRWTEDDFNPEERITCNLVIQLTSGSVSAGNYAGNIQVQASRPIYGSDYESLLFNFVDQDVAFFYQPGMDLSYNDNTYRNDLTSMLAFYSYMMLGMDYDSYSMLGGTAYFDRARTVVNNAQGSSNSGWKESKGPNNRYWLADNINSPQMENFRKGIYNYHRLALDQLHKKPIEGQKIIIDFLKDIQKIRQIVPVSILFSSFFMAKQKELVDVFKGADDALKQQAFDLLSSVDPTSTSYYQKIIK